MVRWRSGTVPAVRPPAGAAPSSWRSTWPPARPVRALAYPELVGDAGAGRPGAAQRRRAGHGPRHRRVRAGGRAARPAARRPAADDGTTRDAGHLVKARYTPLQAILLGVDEEASPHRAVMAAADSLDGMPVVTADLHSALPAILAGIHADRPDARVAYVMTDGGALPAWFSRTLDGLRGPPRRHGHRRPGVRRRPGGEHRAHRPARRPARAARRRRRRRAGPGQPRHRHDLGLLRRRGRRGGQRDRRAGRPAGRLAADLRRRRPAPPPGRLAPQPHRVRPGGAGPGRPGDPGGPAGRWRPPSQPLARAAPDRPRSAPTGWTQALRASPVPLSTMGRGLDEDHAYFLAAAAAGRHAAALLTLD